MKRYLFTLLLLLCAAPALAWNWPVITAMQSGGGGEAACTGTYGNNATTDAGYDPVTTNTIVLSKITVDCSGIPATINYRDKYNSGNVKFLIYSDNGGEPDQLLYASSPVAVGSPSSNTTITDSGCTYSLSSGDYWIGVVADNSGRVYHAGATGGDGRTWNAVDNYTSPPSWNTTIDTPLTTDSEIWITF